MCLFVFQGNIKKTVRECINILGNFPALIGCVHEIKKDDAKDGFKRTCFKDVTIDDVVPLKRNCQPSCAWRVFYKLRGRTPAFVEAGKSAKDFIYPLPDHDKKLKKLFDNITLVCPYGMSVAQKNYTLDKVFGIVDYIPVNCRCPVQDFNSIAKVPLVRSSITEMSMNLSGMKL